MADFAFSALWIQLISLSWGEIKRLKETVSTIEAVLQDVEQSAISEDLEIWLKQLDFVLKNARDLLYEIELRSQDSAGQKLCRFFSSSNPLVFCFRIGHRIKKMTERIDEILAERDRVIVVLQPPEREMPVRRDMRLRAAHHRHGPKLQDVAERIKGISREIIDTIDKLSCFGRDDDRAKLIVYIVVCIVGVCVDPFFLYIPFVSHTKMSLGMNRELWKVAAALRTVADFFTALILIMSIDRPQLSRCMSSIKSILLMCVKFLILAPIPQILFSEKFMLKTLGGYTFWNLILFCHYGARIVLIFQSCEELKTRVSVRTLLRFNAPVDLFLYLIISHVIGASWYYLSIQRQLSCWNYACKIDAGCIFHSDGTTPSSLSSTLVNAFCPLNPQKFGIYLNALQSGIVEEKGVLKKFLQCFFWGLQNLRSFGSNLQTSTNSGETFFAVVISIVALILLIYIIGNIQWYSELESARTDWIVDKMEPIKELIECLVVFHNLDNRTKRSIVEHIEEALENGYKSFNLERLRINHFLNDVTKTESLLKDLRLLEEWVFNGQSDNLGKAKKLLSDNNIPHGQNNILFYLTCRLKDDEDVNLTMKDLGFDFPVESRSANSATERVDSSNRTVEPLQIEIEERV